MAFEQVFYVAFLSPTSLWIVKYSYQSNEPQHVFIIELPQSYGKLRTDKIMFSDITLNLAQPYLISLCQCDAGILVCELKD
jgi:hypothetical protein